MFAVDGKMKILLTYLWEIENIFQLIIVDTYQVKCSKIVKIDTKSKYNI